MMMKPLWPHQERAIAAVLQAIDEGWQRICLQAPTGAGKSRMVAELIKAALDRGVGSAVYSNRRLLIDQLGEVLEDNGIHHGIRMAGREEQASPVQVSSLPTERSRVYRKQKGRLHDAGLVVIDEAHLNAGQTAQQVAKDHADSGAIILGVSATPLDLAHMYDLQIKACTMEEARRVGAILPCVHYGVDEPDMRRFKPSQKTGEYTEGDVRKAIMTKVILGRVIENYLRINTERKPTILFAPGVGESIWFAEQLERAGIRAGHIDAKDIYIRGKKTKDRQAILEASRTGEIEVICNRFVLREGIDAPWLQHCILATVMNGIQTYIQSVGRLLRAFPGMEYVTLQDHGGHWHRHGDVNAEREWPLTWTPQMVSGIREDNIREGDEPEPISCPDCGRVRSSGAVCPQCGYESTRRSRRVIEASGEIRMHEGSAYPPRVVKVQPNTEKLWTSMYYRARNSKKGMNFNEAYGFFFVENHYWPPRNLPLMPVNKIDWYRRVRDVPRGQLVQQQEGQHDRRVHKDAGVTLF